MLMTINYTFHPLNVYVHQQIKLIRIEHIINPNIENIDNTIVLMSDKYLELLQIMFHLAS